MVRPFTGSSCRLALRTVSVTMLTFALLGVGCEQLVGIEDTEVETPGASGSGGATGGTAGAAGEAQDAAADVQDDVADDVQESG